MPLVPQTLEASILATLQKAKANTSPTAEADFARDLATAIDAYIRTATVSTTVVGVATGTAVAGTGTGNLT